MKNRRWALITVVLILLVTVTVPLAAYALTPATPIAPGSKDSQIPSSERYIGAPATPNPVAHVVFPQNPYLASNGSGNNMHNDSYMSDTYEVSGPLGLNPLVKSTYYGIELVVTITFDSYGRMVAVRQGQDGLPHLLLLDPDTLDLLASYDLPAKPADCLPVTKDPTGGVYFCLDNEDNIVVTTNDRKLMVIGLPPLANPDAGFQVIRQYDLSGNLATPPSPDCSDKIAPALPDWGGEYYWYSTRYGAVGTVNIADGTIKNVVLTGEQIQNSPAVAEDGFYVITDYAMYRFTVDTNGNPVQVWRTAVDRGTRTKPGMILQGSGTTPTLIGDLVAIADNADPYMHVLFLRRDTGEVVVSIPVFGANASATENSLIGVQLADGTYSVIVENNYGYASLLTTTGGKTTVGGVDRIDVVPDAGSPTGYSGSIVWASAEISCTPVPKLSLGNGLVYLYTKPDTSGTTLKADEWYFTAVDFQTGATVYRVLLGEGLLYNDNGAPITLGPDGGIAYSGCLGGLLSIRDTTVEQVGTSTGSGTAEFRCQGYHGSIENLVAVSESSMPSQGKPADVQFPHGFFEFRITGLTPGIGESVTLTITLPTAVPTYTQYWKYGPTPTAPLGEWYQIYMGDNDGDNVITITLTDGGTGDDDLIANGVIVDQGGPGWPWPSGGGGSAPAFPSIYIGIGAALGAGILAYLVRRRLAAR